MIGLRQKILDEKDKKILSLLCKNPEISQLEIAKYIELTQPAVGARINKLKKLGFIISSVCIDIKKFPLIAALIQLSVKNPSEIIRKLMKCPYVSMIFTTSGEYNLTLVLLAENTSTIDAIVEKHFRRYEGVSKCNVTIIMDVINYSGFPITFPEKKYDLGETLPCGLIADCPDCEFYHDKVGGKCLGCPYTKEYKGKLY